MNTQDRPLNGKRSFYGVRNVLIVTLILSVTCLLLLIWVGSPRYLSLNIPAPNARGWLYVSKGKYLWSDTGYVYYFWRAETVVYRDDGQFSSKEQIFDYFDSYLLSDGWESYRGQLSCAWELPESSLLDSQTEVVEYQKPFVYEEYPTIQDVICAAVWEIDSEVVEGFNVVLVSVIPSRLTEFWRAWD